MAATRNVHRVRHLSTDAFLRQLHRIRPTDAENAILVVTEGIFSMDGDSSDLPALQAACREDEATLLIDVAHDLGAGGTGSIGLQGLVGQVDLVIGSFSKVFAAEMCALDDSLSTLAQKDPRRAQGSDVMAGNLRSGRGDVPACH
jgi:glycine C-acetyltransferase